MKLRELKVMGSIIAVDPGPEKSAWVVWDGSKILGMGIDPNMMLLMKLSSLNRSMTPILVIEQVECYGMPVGKEVFETVWWTGRFCEQFGNFVRMPRRMVKLHLCGQARAKDGNIRQALVDRFGKPGKKKEPGLTYGLKKDIWQAFALGVTWWDTTPDRHLYF